MSKLEALADDHPLRENYHQWIRELDVRIYAGDEGSSRETLGKPISNNNAFPPSQMVLTSAKGVLADGDVRAVVDKSVQGVGGSKQKSRVIGNTVSALTVQRPAAPTKGRLRHASRTNPFKSDGRRLEETYREGLLSENQLLRSMLERFKS